MPDEQYLQTAQARLQSTLGRLENVLNDRLRQIESAQDSQTRQREMQALQDQFKTSQKKLSEELEQEKSAHQTLQKNMDALMHQTTGKIDLMITQVKEILMRQEGV